MGVSILMMKMHKRCLLKLLPAFVESARLPTHAQCVWEEDKGNKRE